MKTMKRTIALLMSLACVLSLLAILPAQAAADSPGKTDINNAYNADSVQYPSKKSYLSDYEIRYVDCEVNSVNIYYWPSTERGHQKVIFDGQRVTCLAKQGGFTFILYYTEGNELYAGWINSKNLVKDFPGQTFSTGARTTYDDVEWIGDVTGTWSKTNFTGTKQKYTVLDNPVDDCVGFTLDYMVTARNGATTKQCLGTRTIYVYDGDEWYEVGTFRYSKLGPVHCEVTLDEPMRIEAVATTADCTKPNKLSIRQSILDVFCLD